MNRHLLLGLIVVAHLTCCKPATALRVVGEFSALHSLEESAASGRLPDAETFASVIASERIRLGDPGVDAAIDSILAVAADYSPVHLAKAQSLLRHGQLNTAIAEGKLALSMAERAQQRDRRAIYVLLWWSYQVAGDMEHALKYRSLANHH
jgi:hypothetical protein